MEGLWIKQIVCIDLPTEALGESVVCCQNDKAAAISVVAVDPLLYGMNSLVDISVQYMGGHKRVINHAGVAIGAQHMEIWLPVLFEFEHPCR